MSLLLPHEGGGGGGGCFDGEGVAAVGRASNEGGAGAETSSANDAIDATTTTAVSADTAAAAAAAAACGPGWWDVRNRDRIGRSEVQLAQGGIDGAASLLQVEAALRAGASLVEAMTPPPPPEAAPKRNEP